MLRKAQVIIIDSINLCINFKRLINRINKDGGVSNAKFETPPMGLGRFRRESSNLGREAYKGTSSPKVGDRKSPYQYGEFRRNSTDYCLISKISESGTFFLSSSGFFDLVKCDSPIFYGSACSALPKHNANDLAVGLSHAVACQPSDVANGILHPFGDNTVSAVKLLTRTHHFITQ